MSEQKDGGPAFPTKTLDEVKLFKDYPAQIVEVESPGMSLRDYFAAAALTGIYANGNDAFLITCAKEAERRGDTRQSGFYAWEAYEAADAMLRVRNR